MNHPLADASMGADRQGHADEIAAPGQTFPWERLRVQYFKLERRDIQFLVFTLEGLEGQCSVETVDRSAGIVRVWTAMGWETTVDRVLCALANSGVRMIRLDKAPTQI